jgi:hypothetical protein
MTKTWKRIIIGADPAFRKDGFAIAIIDEHKTVSFRRFKAWLDFQNWLMYDAPEPCTTADCIPISVGVENSNLQNVTFDMTGGLHVVAKKSRDAGKNMAISQCCYEAFVAKYGAKNVKEFSPERKGQKWDDATFRLVVKSHGHILDPRVKIGQDERDAYKMATLMI